MKQALRIQFLTAGSLLSILVWINSCSPSWQSRTTYEISMEQASGLAAPALSCIQQPYPYKPGNVLVHDTSLRLPREDHPAFYGCFDWHSAVHGHWCLVKLLKEFPGLPEGPEIREMLRQNLADSNILEEVRFFNSPGNQEFERTYGWAWLLKLSLELQTWNDPTADVLAGNLQPLADVIAARYIEFLDKLPYPIRVGEHSNTAFGLAFAWDYADQMGLDSLKKKITDKAMEFYMDDQDCPVDWEPGGFDFLSPCLVEADLMTRILDEVEYRRWIHQFMPQVYTEGELGLQPPLVTDRSDGKIVHLEGLNFSRAWCLFRIADKLGPTHRHLEKLAIAHMEASLPHVTSGYYEGEHWLASFAVYAVFSVDN